jgi:HTH-type transcriptional regulator, competence development regulator
MYFNMNYVCSSFERVFIVLPSRHGLAADDQIAAKQHVTIPSCPRVSLTLRFHHMAFGEHIRKGREERRIGLRQFAKAVGVSPTFVSKMERSIGPLPGEATIRKMAAILGENPDELLAMANKVADDVLAIIKKEPAIARFLRANPHLTKDQLNTLSQSLTDLL